MADIVLDSVSKVYSNGVKAVKDLALEINDGEFMVLVGPSGCGKTTVLRMVAGLEQTTAGTIRIGGRDVTRTAPRDRDIAMVFQNYALYPHMSVRDNIGFGLRQRRVDKRQIRSRVDDAARLLGLSEVLDRRPNQLSGGQRQRVAMGRAIVRHPAAFLMDEPLSNLDAKLRVQMRAEVTKLQRRIGVATLYVTHDQTEAMTMGDRVAVMDGGVLQQCDAPQTLYDEPANLFVATFVGSPMMNVYKGYLRFQAEGRSADLIIGAQKLSLDAEMLARWPEIDSYADGGIILGVRPEHIRPGHSDDLGALRATVELVESLGTELLIHYRIEGLDASTLATKVDRLDDGGLVEAGKGIARAPVRTPVRVGDSIGLRIDITEAHLFDPESGYALVGSRSLASRSAVAMPARAGE